jgi:hypothetical protein
MKGRSLLLIAGAAAIVGCGDPTRPVAANNTIGALLTVFAFSGTPLSAPTAINTLGARTVVASGSSNFDVVFDIRDGQAVAIPPLAIIGIGNAAIQKVSVPFDSLNVAPVDGYNDSSAVAIGVGDVLAVRSQPVECSNAFGLSPFIYSKMVVKAINASDTSTTGDNAMPPRTIQLDMVVDPNCNFRSLAPGVPTS